MGLDCSGMQPDIQSQFQNIQNRATPSPSSLDQIRRLSKHYIQSRNIPQEHQYCVEMLVSIRQIHLAQHLRMLPPEEKAEFVQKIKGINFEELDHMIHEESRHRGRGILQQRGYSKRENVVSRYKVSGEQGVYETGRMLIKQRAVAVMMTVGCFGDSGGEELPFLQPLKLPSGKSCLQLSLERVVYLNQTTHSNILVILVVASKLRDQLVEWVNKLQLDLKSVVKVYTPDVPNVSLSGDILLQDQHNFSYEQGQGDFLREIKKMGILEDLSLNHIEYLHICCPNNILQRVADPFCLGYLEQNQLDVVCKVVEGSVQDIDQKCVYLVESQDEEVCVKGNVPLEFRKYVFVNSIFMTVSYLQSLSRDFKSQTASKLKSKRIKTSYFDPVTQQFVFSNSDNAIYFYRNPSDLISGSNHRFLKVHSKLEYHSLSSPHPEIALSNYFKLECGIEGTGETDILEISPLLLYDGEEGVEEIRKEIGKAEGELGFPCYIK